MDKHKQLILNGNLPNVMWQMSWPAVVAMVLFGLNNFLDGVFVGHLINDQALAAVGIAFPLAQIGQAIGSLIGTGAGAGISIWIGAENIQKLSKSLGSVNYLSIVFSVIFMIPAYIYADELIHLMGGRGDIAILASQYYKVIILGTFFWVHGLALNMMIRAEGKMKMAALMIAIGLVIDIALKPIFIATFGWGVVGAAWATNISMMVYTILGVLYYHCSKSSFKTNIWSLHKDSEIIRLVIKLGMPALIMMIMVVIQNIIIFNALSKYGTDSDITFFTVVNRFYLLLCTPMFGLMRALQPVAGMNYGVCNYSRVKKSYLLFTWTGFCLLIPFWCLVMLFPQDVLTLMIPNQVFSTEQLMNFRVYMSVLLVLPAIFMAMVWFPSVDNARPASLIAVSRQLLLYVPIMLVVPIYYGIDGIYWASALIDWGIFIVVVLAIRNNFSKMI